MTNMNHLKIVTVFLLSMLLAACGGGSDAPPATGTTATGTSVKASGVMTKGSVIVNGVSFAVLPATAIRVDDTTGVLEDNLKNGMVVRVRGNRNDDGLTGAADAVETENEVQGRVTSVDTVVNPQTFIVLGQTIYVDAQTVYANLVNLAGLTAGNGTTTGSIVEVHGLRDSAGNLRASRVELLGALGANEMELKGVAANLNVNGADTITIGNGTLDMVVNFNTASREPAGAAINNGDLVEVKGNLVGGVLVATLIQREDLEDAEFEPNEGQEFEVEGFMAGFSGHPGSFTINGRNVQTTAATIFRSGSEEDLGNGTKVEAEGHLSGGVLAARKITFKNKRVEIQATATANTATSVTVMGLNVAIAPFTDNVGITNGQRYRIKGFDDGGTIIAERIVNGSGGGDDWLKALVTAEDEGAKTLGFLGGSVTANLGTNLVFKDAGNNAITETAFYSGVTAGSTLVKVKFNAGTFIVNEASLED
ncbi:MAG: hypothetical protein KKG47_15565 [Proteobacteria bacterium]|nr:hypothetical protein [Pseudomonadota bacterium]MBU1737951.1 hypothetical protein [Pseudomonadota bacterium]